MSDPTPPSEPTDGLDALRQRVERRRRVVPPPRRAPKPAEAASEEGGASEQPARPTPPAQAIRRARSTTAADAPRHGAASGAAPTPEADVEPTPEVPTSRDLAPTSHEVPAERGGDLAEIVLGGPPERFVQLGVRVRAGFDQRLDDLVYQFRRDGVRTSKAELVELLLFELPTEPNNDLRARLAAFRRHAPRLGL